MTKIEPVTPVAVGDPLAGRALSISTRVRSAADITDETTATVIHLDTGEILSEHHIDPARSYWRNQQQEPGRWPGS